MKQAENVIKTTPQLEFDPANGKIYWKKTCVARDDRKTGIWSNAQAWSDAIGID